MKSELIILRGLCVVGALSMLVCLSLIVHG